ncbi:MAG: hypothetical protein JXB07_12650 [Anaerolineae bacterium]|nr:hypothetical protein [Anaerolineae bacterium]
MKKFLLFTLMLTLAHIITYYVFGALAYELFTKQFYQGENPTFIFMRTESDPLLWQHTMAWMLPGQALRGILMALALLPFMKTLVDMNVAKRALALASIYFVFSHLSAAGPTTSNIEGFIYFRPEYFNARIFLLTQPEIIFQALGLGICFSLLIHIKRIRRQFNPTSDQAA